MTRKNYGGVGVRQEPRKGGERGTPMRDHGWAGQRVKSLHGRDAAARSRSPQGPAARLPLEMRAKAFKGREGGRAGTEFAVTEAGGNKSEAR